MATKLEKLFTFQKANPEYVFVKLIDDIDDNNEFHTVGNGSFGQTSGITNFLRFGVAPKNDLYEISELTNFLKYFDEKMETSKETSSSGSDFAIENKKSLFSKKGTFTRGDRSIDETLDFTGEYKIEFVFNMNDKHLLENKEEELKKLNLVSRTNSYLLEKEKAHRTIDLRFFPSVKMLNHTQYTERHSYQKYTSEELIEIIGKEKCYQLFNWNK